MNKDKINKQVSDYYTRSLKAYGATSKGVDWNSQDSQELRFEQLSKIINEDKGSFFSVLDFGCGYGAIYPFLEKKYSKQFKLIGYDLSEEMIKQAQILYGKEPNTRWVTDLTDYESKADYTIASGIFNVRLKNDDDVWKKYILDILGQLNTISEKGFAFNMLTSYSDKEYMRDHLYYADPAFYFDYCKRNFSKYVAVLHDYPLYEFTIHVKKI